MQNTLLNEEVLVLIRKWNVTTLRVDKCKGGGVQLAGCL